MALYAIGDLHLCLGAPKPMDIFGGAWVGYMDKLKEGVAHITEEEFRQLKHCWRMSRCSALVPSMPRKRKPAES